MKPPTIPEKFYPAAILLLFAILLFTVLRASLYGSVSDDKHVYFEIVFLLLLAVLGELAVSHLKQPSVMVLMLVGILISPSFLSIAWGAGKSLGIPIPPEPPDILRSGQVIAVFAQLGAIILLFKVGLHNKIEGIFAHDNLVVAIAGVLLPFAAGYLYASMSGGDFAYSMFLAASLTATSVGVTVALLRDMDLMGERFAQIIVGAAVIDDILGLLVLSFVLNMTGAGTFANALLPLAATAVSAIVFIAGGILAGKYFIDYLDRAPMGPKRLLLVLAFMLFYAYVAEYIKLSAIVGAFVAGVILNRSKHIHEIEEQTYGLEVLFMPMFFITLGTLVDVNALLVFAVPIVALVALAFASKAIACTIASLWAKLRMKEALAVGIGMVPRGEVALIVASIGLTSGVLSAAQYSVISAMALLTTFIVPPIMSRMLARRR